MVRSPNLYESRTFPWCGPWSWRAWPYLP